jgi:hypothetical protein
MTFWNSADTKNWKAVLMTGILNGKTHQITGIGQSFTSGSEPQGTTKNTNNSLEIAMLFLIKTL